MQRRTLLGLGAAGAAALTLAGAGAALMSAPTWREGRLQPAGREVMAAVARGVLDGSWPAGAQRAALASYLQRLEAAMAALPAASQDELARLLQVLAAAIGRRTLAGLSAPWPDATPAQLQAALQSMRESRWLLRRQAYHALRDLTHAAWFADASTWSLLRYPGPVKIG